MPAVTPSGLALDSPVFCPQERSPFPAPTAAEPSPTAPTFGPTSRPTRMSRSISARPAPEPFRACPCCTSTKSQAARGAPLTLKAPSASPDPPPAIAASILPTATEFPSELPLLAAFAPQDSEDLFPVLSALVPQWALREAFPWTFL